MKFLAITIVLLCFSIGQAQDTIAPPFNKVWEFNGQERFNNFIVHKDTLYYSTLFSYGAIDIDSGALLWEKKISEDYRGTYIAVDEENLYVTASDGRLIAYEPMTLEQLWGMPIKGQIGAMGVIGTMLICTTDEGVLSAIDTGSHNTLWKTDLTLLSTSTGSPRYLRLSIEPQIKENSLIVATFTGEIFALDPGSGGFHWRTRLCSPDRAQIFHL